MKIKLFFLIFLFNVFKYVDSCVNQIQNSPFDFPNTGKLVITPQLSTGKTFVVASSSSADLSSYILDNKTGKLTSTGNSVALSAFPLSMAATPEFSGKVFVAVPNSSNQMQIFSLDSQTGVFLPVLPTPVTGVFPLSIDITTKLTNDNVFAATANFSSKDVSIYSVNSNGVFEAIAGSPYSTGADSGISIAYSQELSSSNLFAAIAFSNTNKITNYLVNQDTGQFINNPLDSKTVTNAQSINFSPELSNGKLFAVATSSSDIIIYSVDIVTGLFTQINSINIPGSSLATAKFTQQLSNGSLELAVVDRNKKFYVYSVNISDGSASLIFSSDIPQFSFFVGLTQQYSNNNLFMLVPNSDDPSNNVLSIFKSSNITLTSARTFCSGILNVKGVARALDKIKVFVDDKQIGAGKADSNGNYNINIQANLKPGKYTIKTQINSATCNNISNLFTLNVNRLSTPNVTSVFVNSSCEFIGVTGNGVQPNANINIFINSILRGTTKADNSGNFETTIPTNFITNFPTELSVQANQKKGTCVSLRSEPFNVKVNCTNLLGTDTLTKAILLKYGCKL